MKLSTKGRYAVRILACIARNQSSGPVCKGTIADEELVSKDYIEQIIVMLKRAGLVEGLRGTKGGFVLSKPASEITLYDVISAAEGGLELVQCSSCTRSDECNARDIWSGASKILREYFTGISLESVGKPAKVVEN